MNTSGTGEDAVVPPELLRSNWGASIFGHIWLAGHGMLNERMMNIMLTQEPRLGWSWSSYLGRYGNELAWKYRRWDSVEAFQRVERRWHLAAVLFCAFMLVALLIPIYFVWEALR